MKYFTEEWCFSNLDDQEIEERLKSYREYVKKIYKKIPFVLKILANNINLHDGKLKKVSFIQDQSSLVLNGVFGDLQSGYFFLEIKYLNVSFLNLDVLNSVFENKEIEILSNEIEMLAENSFSHKMLFSTKREIDILFKDIQIVIQNAGSKDYKKLFCQFEAI